MKKIDIPKEVLQKYISSGMTVGEISKILNVSKSTITNKFKEFGIRLKKDYSNIFTKDFLSNNKLSITKLSIKYNCSTDVIWKYYKKYNIPYTKNIEANELLSDRDFLYEEYITKNRTLTDISLSLNCGRLLVKKYLNDHNIEKKPRYKERVWDKTVDLKDLSSGKTSKEISLLYGCSEEYIRQQQIINDIPRLSGWNQSSIERKVHSILTDNDIDFDSNVKTIIYPMELDIYIPKYKIAIETNGIYFHTEKFLDKNYHENKRLLCEKNGIRLLSFFEDDIENKFDIIKDIILTACFKSNKERIYARKCDIKKINDSSLIKDFLNTYHIQGFAKSTEAFCLYYKDAMVAVMLFEGEILTRYATSCHVIGGFSKLIKHSNKKFIKTYVDYNTFTGNVYEKTGFCLSGYIKPDYKYVYKNKRFHKFNFRKERFRKDDLLLYNENLTEHQLAQLNNILRIYDSGKGIYTWHRQEQDSNLKNIA